MADQDEREGPISDRVPRSEPRAPEASMPASNPMPNSAGYMTTAAKLSLAEIALALRDEQLEAQVIHYRADLETNPDLDAITAQVVQELQGLQTAVKYAQSVTPNARPERTLDRAQIEQDLIQGLADMLGRVFRPDRLATMIERKLGEVAKRFARVFFESELAERIRGSQDELKTMRFYEQALFHALQHAEATIFAALDSFSYDVDNNVRDRAATKYFELQKQLRNDFLARTTPELNTLISYLNEVLSAFFTRELPPTLFFLSLDVVKEAGLADRSTTGGYKISATTFPLFRVAFERHFLRRLVPYVEEEMLSRVRLQSSQFRSETIRLIADPVIFSEVCEVVCDAVYDMLYNDGFLDLPSDWRARLSAGG